MLNDYCVSRTCVLKVDMTTFPKYRDEELYIVYILIHEVPNY